MNVFNDASTIERAILSIHEVADEVHIFDGAYADFPHDKPYSTDGTLEIAAKFSKVIIHPCTEPYKNQLVKRTKMFEVGHEGDMFFKFDGDEYCTNPEIIRKSIQDMPDVAWAWVLSNLYPRPYMTTRIFKYQEGLHYEGRHHWLFNGKNVFVASDQNMNVRFVHKDTPIRLFNMRHKRSSKRQEEKMTFIRRRNVSELSFKSEGAVYGKIAHLRPHPNRAGLNRNPSFVIRSCEDPVDYTYTVMLSRKWAVDKYLDHLTRMQFPENTEIIAVVDSDKTDIADKLVTYLKQDRRFVNKIMYFTGRENLPELAKVHLRRQRIADNWHILLTEARGKYILAGEDDSLPQYDAYLKLITLLHEENADFTQGNIIGRWGSKICPAWHVIERGNIPDKVWTGKEQQTGFEEIQGCGWYCFVAPIEVVQKHAMQVDGVMPLGPDVNFGYRLWKSGFKLLHSWDVKVEHFGEDFSYYPGECKTEQRIWLKKSTIWISKEFSEDLLNS